MNSNKSQFVLTIVVGALAGLGGAVAAGALQDSPSPARWREAPRVVEPDDEHKTKIKRPKNRSGVLTLTMPEKHRAAYYMERKTFRKPKPRKL